ncbi:MAG: hypothetical protein WCQ00_00965 [bacterium]
MTATSIERNTEQFNKLPESFKTAIKASDYDKSLALISKEHKLHIDQSSMLEELLAKLIFGDIESEDIISEMKSKLNLSKEEATKIAAELDQMIIKEIKRNLMNIQKETTVKEDVE